MTENAPPLPTSRVVIRFFILASFFGYMAFRQVCGVVTLGEDGEASLNNFLAGLLKEKGVTVLSPENELEYNMSASGVYYPRPRRQYSEFHDCGCPYTCDDTELDTIQAGQQLTCRQSSTKKMRE